MLSNLVINNGVLSPNFSPLINIYTVSVDYDVFSLNILYESEYNVNIINNNNFESGENEVTIVIEETNQMYKLIVNKEEETTVVFQEVELIPNTVPVNDNTIFFVFGFIVFLILIMFKSLFLSKKK